MQEIITRRKIYYYDTDAGGVVYYGNYLNHLEEGRTEFCLKKGVDTGELFSKDVAFVVVHMEVDYKSPARYGQTIDICTGIEKIGNSSIHFVQEIKNGDKTVLRAKIVWACVNARFQTMAVPESIRKALLL